MSTNKPVFTKWDTMILLFLLLVGIFFSVWIFLPDSAPGNFLEIRQNGKVLKTLPLNQNTRETISGEGGTNTFIIQDGSVSMIEADCGDHTCIQTGSIQKNGESIVCLPHRLVLQIIVAEEGGSTKTQPQPDGIVH